MGKRSSRGAADLGENPRKRQRVVHEPPTHEEIHASRQLKELLAFEQDVRKARHGLQSFKVFLDKLAFEDGDGDAERRLLYEYLNSARPRDDDEAAPFLPGIMDTWSFAGQVNNDNILSAVPVVLALLLRVLSRDLEFVPYGLGICRTLLQKRQQELIARNLSADKGKEFIISPTLRLLTEALSFDGGAVARPIFRARNNLLKSLARNMGIRYLGEGLEDPKRTSARTNAVRFFLSALRFLHQEAKKELLLQKDVVVALARTIKDDPPGLVMEILTTLRTHVLLDGKLPREAKGRLLNSHTLSRLIPLYTYEHGTPDADGSRAVPEVAHEFLKTACTVHSAGVLWHQSGFYPRGTAQEMGSAADPQQARGLGLEAVVWMDKFRQEVPVHNVVLSDLVQGLRPWSNIKQAELLVSIFSAAPELVADYFLKKKAFTFEPKLSATWIGYAAFLFSVVALDIPRHFGRQAGYSPFPPPTSVVMDNILPLPLNQKTLLRCLSHKSKLVSFFATRLLVVAMQKLDAAIKLHQDASHANSHLWEEASRRLVDEFCQRSPDMKDIVNSYRSIPEEDILHREAASRLVRLYYEVIPQVALTAKFDVSPSLVVSIKRMEAGGGLLGDPRDRGLGLRELEHLLAIARYSPGMRWFADLDGLALSPFTTLLRLTVDAQHGISSEKVLDILNLVAREQQLVVSTPARPGLAPIVQSLRSLTSESHKPGATAEVWSFLDKCTCRCATRPIKYLELAEGLLDGGPGPEGGPARRSALLAPLTVAMLEQLPPAVETGSKAALAALADFLGHFVAFSSAPGDDAGLLATVSQKLQAIFPKALRARLQAAVTDAPGREGEPRGGDGDAREDPPQGQTPASGAESQDPGAQQSLDRLFEEPAGLELDNSALVRWSARAADELIEEGYAVGVLSLLASEHTSIRKEALTNTLKMAAKIRESDYEEKEQCWLLLSELAESARQQVNYGPVPSPVVSFACHALDVLRNPLHSLYAKVNAFLTRGPVWRLDKLPLVYEVLEEEPSADDSYYAGLDWLASYLLGGLRTPEDVALFHKKRLFERLLSLASNPYMRAPLRTRLLRVLYQTTAIEGGSTTLTTRFGIVAWLESQKASGGDDAWLYEALARRVWETADQGRILEWSRGGIREVVGAAAGETAEPGEMARS